MADNSLIRIIIALLKHRVKLALGEETLGVIGQELADIGGQEVDDLIKEIIGDKSKVKELQKAENSAINCFYDKIGDPELQQWMMSLPLGDLPKIVEAIDDLPTSSNEDKLKTALHESISVNWKKLSRQQVDFAVDTFLSCLRNALLPIEKQTIMIIGRSVLRTEDKVDLLISWFDKYIIHQSDEVLQLKKNSTSDNQLLWGVSVDRYRQHLKELHSKVRVFNKESVPISSFYVDLFVTSGLASMRHQSIIKLNVGFRKSRSLAIEKEARFDLRDLILEKNKIFLSGNPGAGKTTALKHLTVLAAEGKIELLPIYISLTNWANSSLDLMQFIEEEFELCEFPNATPFIEGLLEIGGAIVFFDGFDEVVEENGLRRQIRDKVIKFVDKYSKNKFIISCRNAASNYQFHDFAYFEISDFDDDQVSKYINNWFSNDQITASKLITQIQQPHHWNIKELSHNPLLLNLLCIVFDETKNIPSRKADLYREAMDCLLRKWDESKDIKRDRVYQVLSLKNKKRLLEQLAFKFSNQGIIFFDQDKVEPLIVDFFSNIDSKENKYEIDGGTVLNAIEAQHGLIVKRAEYIYSFSHLSFQEYFASRHIIENNSSSVLRDFFSHIHDDTWDAIFLLTSEMQKNANTYFSKFSKNIHSKIVQDKKLTNILKWADENRQENYPNVHPALGRIVVLRTLVNIDNIVDQIKPVVSNRGYFIAEKLALFLHLDLKIDVELSDLAEIANCIALNKPLSKTLKNEFIRILKLAENRADFHQDGPSYGTEFNFEQARRKIQNYILSLEDETKQQIKLNFDMIWSDSMVREFSNVLNINLSTITMTFINKERILANNRLPKQTASIIEWDSFRKGLKKDILGDYSLLYDLSMTDTQRAELNKHLRANILFARCLHVSTDADVSKFENLLITLQE